MTQKPRFFRAMRWVNWLLLACALPVFMALVALVGACAYLSVKPLSLKPFFPLIEHTILEENVTLEADDILLSYHKRLRLTVDNLTAKKGKQILARIGEAEVDFTNRQLLLLRLRPKHIRVSQTVAHLTRTADSFSIGGLLLWQRAETDTPAEAPRVVKTLDIVSALLDKESVSVLQNLKTLQLSDLFLLVQDKEKNITWLLENGAASTERFSETGLKLKVTAKIRQKEQPLVKAMPLTLTLEQTAGELADAGVLVRAGVARSDTDLLKPYLPENLKNAVQAEGTFGVETTLHRGNKVDPPSFFLNLKNVTLNIPQAFDHALVFQSVKAKGRYRAEQDFLRVKELIVEDDAGYITTASATIQNVKTTPYITAEATSDVATLKQIKHYFPTVQMEKTLHYLDQNIKDVLVKNARATYQGFPEKFKNCGAECGLEVFADIVSGRARFLDKASFAEAGNGTFYLGQNRIDIAVQQGRYAQNRLEEVHVRVAPIFEPEGTLKHVYVSGTGQGALQPLLADLAQEFDEINQIPDASAQHQTQISLTVPIFPGDKKALLPDIALALKSTMENVTITLGEDLSLKAPTADFNLKNGKATLHTQGDITALDMPMTTTLTWEEDLLKPNAGKGNVWLSLPGDVLTKRLNMPDMLKVSGTFPLHLTLKQLAANVYAIDATSNAESAAVTTHALGFTKGAAVPLKLSVSGQVNLKPQGKTGPPQISLEMLTLTGDQVEVAGSAEIEGGKITKVNLAPVKIGAQDAQQVVVEPNRISILGNALDLRQLNLFENEGEDKKTLPENFVVGINLKLLQLNNEGSLSNVQAAIRREKGIWQTLEAKGDVNWDGLQPFALTMTPQEDGTRLVNATAKDTGKLLQALGLYSNMRGGTLQASLVLDEKNIGGGVISVNEHRFVEAPILAQILNLASLDALLDSQSGIKFNSMTIPVALEPHVLKVRKAEIKGNSMDIYVDGYIALPENAAKEINVDGRLVPGIAMNRTLAKIPVIGTILSGSQDGIIVADFKVKGPLEEPKISVKPLSLVTPGVVKDIFNGIFGGNKKEE